MRYRYWILAFYVGVVLVAGFVVFGKMQADATQTALSAEQGYWAAWLRVVELVVIAITAGTIILLIEQMSQTNRWNRRLSYHQFFSEVPEIGKLMAFNQLAVEKKIDALNKAEPLKDDVAQQLLDDTKSRQIVMNYLNDFEEFAAAVRRDLVDESYAYVIEHARVKRAWLVFRPWIMLLRKQAASVDCYVELEELAGSWENHPKYGTKKKIPEKV